MKKNRKILIGIVAFALTVAILAGICYMINTSVQKQNKTGSTLVHLERKDWNSEVKAAVNDLIDMYSPGGAMPSDNPYAVFDFDNTCSIFDMEEQTVVYQLQTMAFEIKPGQMKEILTTGIPDPDEDLTAYGINGSFNDLAGDIASAYSVLWDKYGPFTSKGVSSETAKALADDPDWNEFAVKIFIMYDSLGEVCSHEVSYPWMTYLFMGMTENQLYGLTSRALDVYSGKETSEVTWQTSDEISSRTGPASYTWTSGVTVTDNMVELWKTLDENGIDIWVCSASATGIIKAAIDHFGLHDHCKGMLGMTDKMDSSGRYINEYDYETGCGYYAVDKGWERMDRPTKAQTQGKGKVTAVVNAVAPEYDGHGPIAGFMDSTGDFNFCTEFGSLKLVVCFNRATRAVTEGGGLIAELAVYQKDSLGYDLAKANNAGDTLYVLQGRDENGSRAFRNSRSTIRYGQTEEMLFKSEENYAQLEIFEKDGLTTEEIIDKWSIIRDEKSSGLGFETGFLEEYDGYHNIK